MDHHNHNFWWRYFPHKQLTQMYFSSAMRSFAISLIALFVPLYLFVERGFSLHQTLQFFIFYAVVFAMTTPIAAKFCSKYGLKHSILLSVPLYIMFILLLYLLPVVAVPLPLIAAFLAFSLAFYWIGMHTAFHHVSDHKHRGEEVGKRASVSILANMCGPLIGGLLIKFTGFKIVFVLATLVLLGSALFLFLSKEDYVKYHFSFSALFDRKHWEYPLVFMARGMRTIANGVLWPLFIYGILNDYLTLGLVGFILSALSALLVWIMGKFSDKKEKRNIIQWVVGFESLSWFLRAFVSSVGQVIGISIFGGITYGAMESPLGAMEYDKANKNNVVAYFVGREIYICIGRILLLSFVIMIDNIAGGFIFNGFANLLIMLF
jgi:MFS family permease